ncbi:hypothetical protein D3C84_763740 [compost metagenome]
MADRLDKKVANVVHFHLIERIGRCTTFVRDFWLEEVQLYDPADNGFMTGYWGVLTDNNRSAELRLVGFVRVVFHTTRAQQTTAEEVFQLVPVKGFGVRCVAVPIAFDQHDRHTRNLAH